MQLVRAAILDRLLVDRASRRHSDRINMYIYTLRYFFLFWLDSSAEDIACERSWWFTICEKTPKMPQNEEYSQQLVPRYSEYNAYAVTFPGCFWYT